MLEKGRFCLTFWRLLPYKTTAQFFEGARVDGRLWPPSVFKDGGESGPDTTSKDEIYGTSLRIVG